MIILVDSLPETNKVLNETRILGEKLSPVFQVHGTSESFAPGSRIFDVDIERSGVLQITDGSAKLLCGENVLALAGAGDVIGTESLAPHKLLRWEADFAVKGLYLPYDRLATALSADREVGHVFLQILAEYIQILAFSLSHVVPQDEELPNEFLQFNTGEMIIEQGTVGLDVYNMLSGRADVLVDGVKVAEIGEEEIFGAVAALTEEKRTATVVANCPCFVIRVPTKSFKFLLKTRPDTVMKLVNDLSRAIIATNNRLLQLEKS